MRMAVVVVEPGRDDGHGRPRGGQEFMYAMASATLPGAVRDAAHLARHMRTRTSPRPAGRGLVAT